MAPGAVGATCPPPLLGCPVRGRSPGRGSGHPAAGRVGRDRRSRCWPSRSRMGSQSGQNARGASLSGACAPHCGRDGETRSLGAALWDLILCFRDSVPNRLAESELAPPSPRSAQAARPNPVSPYRARPGFGLIILEARAAALTCHGSRLDLPHTAGGRRRSRWLLTRPQPARKPVTAAQGTAAHPHTRTSPAGNGRDHARKPRVPR
jgi:hypothetical protein